MNPSMVPTKIWSLFAVFVALAAVLAGCAEPEETSDDTDPDLDPGAGQTPFDDTNDNLTTDDEDLGDEGTGNETDENMTDDTNTTEDTNTTGTTP